MSVPALHVLDTGSGDGPPVVWLHGYTMDSTLWAPLWHRLPRLRHVGIDLPGHGGSAAMPAGLTLPALAAQVAATVTAVGSTRLVAQSWGSCVALQLAIDHPALLTHLVLGAPTVAGAPAAPGTAQRTRELMMLHRMTGPGPHLTAAWMAAPPDIFSGAARCPELYAELASVIDRHSWDELGAGAMATLTRSRHAAADLASIGARTTVLVGTEDMPQFQDNARLLEREVRRCTVHVVPGAGHLPLLEAPDLAAEVLAPALSE